MPSRIEPISPGESDDEDVNEILRASETGWYRDSAYFGAVAHQPRLLKRLVETFRLFPRSDSIDAETLELMRLRVAAVHRCAYCGTVRTWDVKDAVEPKEDAVFSEEIDTSTLTRREELAVRVADYMSRDPQEIPDEFFGELSEEYSDETIIELLLFAGLEVGLDRFCIALRLDTTETSPYPTGLEYPLERET
ncbi:carboxymuconolactone decarboxylase family protein [Natrialbaceae archaeon AArc-T1-2]|uniref:carboxymuconolactone decarboxylase family protein n=1 Tax=Natrialbaceae archaeon AArc-T1-2 TaxID=3053904 RepID=UPI00255AA984|nr:carboxymuconolactone decarboxylase family protein [Natrialbaceae archaeon AArc-T1-2]WIV68800.1 carboxymuconolactone decarboxylase family protein [Natrialbaceae archaeon AArc-T1-2]